MLPYSLLPTYNNDCYLIAIRDNDRAITAIKPLSKKPFPSMDGGSTQFRFPEERNKERLLFLLLRNNLILPLALMIDPAPLFSVMSKYNESPPYNKYKILKSLVPEYCVIKNTIDFEERHLCCQKHRLNISRENPPISIIVCVPLVPNSRSRTHLIMK